MTLKVDIICDSLWERNFWWASDFALLSDAQASLSDAFKPLKVKVPFKQCHKLCYLNDLKYSILSDTNKYYFKYFK